MLNGQLGKGRINWFFWLKNPTPSHHIACPNWYKYFPSAIVFTFTANALEINTFQKGKCTHTWAAIVFWIEFAALSIFRSVKFNDNPFFREAIVIFCTQEILVVFITVLTQQNHLANLHMYTHSNVLCEEQSLSFPKPPHLCCIRLSHILQFRNKPILTILHIEVIYQHTSHQNRKT